MNDNENKTNEQTIKLPVRYDGEYIRDADNRPIGLADAVEIVAALNEADALRAEVEERRRPVHVTKAEIDAVPDGDSAKWEPMALAICHKIESMGASEDLTELSVMANELRQSIGAFNKYCNDQFEQMCLERPDLEPLLRGTIKPNAAAGETGEQNGK